MNQSRNLNQLPDWRHQLADYPSESHFADVSGFQMHYVDEGQGRPVLMVHGNPTWSFYYRHLVGALSGSRRAIAIDHLGCGLSEKPAGNRFDLDDRIQHLTEFVRKLDLQNITLLVHDWGGAIGLGAALEDLDRYQSFVIFNTAAFPPPFFPLRIRVCRAPLLGKLALQGGNLFARAALKMATELPEGLPAATRAGMIAPYDSWSNRRAIYDFVADIPTRPAQKTWVRLADIEQGLARLADRPVKLIWGMQDWCFRPECLRMFQQRIPHAEVCELNSAGHYVIEDAREQVIQEVEQFLARQET